MEEEEEEDSNKIIYTASEAPLEIFLKWAELCPNKKEGVRAIERMESQMKDSNDKEDYETSNKCKEVIKYLRDKWDL